MSDRRDLSENLNPTAAEAKERAARKAAEDQAFAGKLAKRPPPNPVERAEIEKAIKRTKARARRIAMNIEERGSAGRAFYPDHSDDEGHRYQLADTFGTRSLEFVHAMLKRFRECDREPFAGLRFQSSPCQSSQIECRPGGH
jgi:hypothetical protein